jgi:hypothetical protein
MMRRFALLVLTSLLSTATSAAAQGVFDMGDLNAAIANTVQAGPAATLQAPAPPPSPAALAALQYTPSLDLRKANIAKLVVALKQTNAEAGTAFEQVFAQNDVIPMIGQEIAKYNLKVDNIADAYTLYFLGSWMAVNGRSEDPTAAQVTGTRDLVLKTLVGVPDLGKMSDADKQGFAEGLLLQFFMNEAMSQAVASDPAATKKVRGDLKTGFKETMKLDLDLFNLTANGLVRK